MVDINFDWVKKQLSAANIPQDLSTSVKRLLKELESMRLRGEELKTVLDAFHELALGHSIEPEKADEKWVQALPGEYSIGDAVRVHRDAYTGSHGDRHNGKRGVVVGVRGAKAIVLYDDAASSEEQFYHDPKVLDRLV